MGKTAGVWAALALWSAPALGQVDYSGGFATPTGLQINGMASVSGSRLRLTEPLTNQTGSCFTAAPQAVGAFTTTFRIQFTAGSSPMADGICFVLQRAGATAIGAGGGAKGYAGIATSIAVKFDIFPNAGSYTGLYTNGAAPDLPETVLNPGIDFHNGSVFRVDIVYDGVDLDVTITDTGSSASASQTYAIDIPAVIGGNTAYAGFTAATGGSYAAQEVLDWTYNPPAPPVPAPATLNASTTEFGQVTLTWAAVSGATSYQLLRGSAAGGPYGQIATVTAPATAYTDVVAPGPWYYVVRAVTPGGVSGNSPEGAGVSLAQPRTSPQGGEPNEGRCGCGTTSGAAWSRLACAAALLALAFGVEAGRRGAL